VLPARSLQADLEQWRGTPSAYQTLDPDRPPKPWLEPNLRRSHGAAAMARSSPEPKESP